MTAAVTAGHGAPFNLVNLHTGPLGQDEILVRIAATGVCQTDAHSRNGDMLVPMPAVLGHEGAGVVQTTGSAVTAVSPGDHVALTFPSCGRCRPCLAGSPANCLHGFRLSFGCARADGTSAYVQAGVHGHFFGQSSFATFARATERNVIKIDEEMPLALAGPLGCGVQTGAGAVLNSLQVTPGSSLAIFGTGAVGLSAVMAATIAGASTIVAVDVNDGRLRLAEELGATHTVNGRDDDVGKSLRSLAPDGLDYVIEITGLPDMLALAVDCVGPMGTAGLVGGAPAGTTAAIDMNRLLNGGRRVHGIAQGDSIPHIFIPKLVEFYRAGRLPLEKIVKTYEMAEINEAFEDAARGEAIKPVLTMPAS
ncbi:MAG TPA: NAD(P)-dependent alcohol dehydrogenase [Streptosporangiaceae bacterium]